MSVLFNAFSRKDDLPGLALRYPGKVNIFDEETPYNDLDPEGEPPLAHALATARHLMHGRDLLAGTVDFLGDAIAAVYRRNGVLDGSVKYPVWPEVYERIFFMKPMDNMQKYYKTVTCEIIRALMLAFGRALEYRKGLDSRHIQGTNNIFIHRTSIPPALRRFRVLGHLDRDFSPRQRVSFEDISRMPLRVCIVDDSAEIFHTNFERHGDPPPLFERLSLARQYRLCFIFSSQYPELLGRSAWDNHSSTFCYQLPSQESRKKVGELFGSAGINEDRKLREAREAFLQRMEPCTGVVRHPRHRLPTPIIATPIDIPSMTTEQKRSMMAPLFRAHPPVPWFPEKAPEKSVISDAAMRLLMMVATKPGLYSSHYYRELGLSLATGTRVRAQLDDDGAIKVHKIVTGKRGGTPEIIELLPPAYEKLGLMKPQRVGKGASFEHSWWCSKIKQRLEANGNA
jgi:hypothetical protein